VAHLGRWKRGLHVFCPIGVPQIMIKQSDEAPAAILIAHGAHLTFKKQSRRRAAYWYAAAASRLEKCGIVSRTSLSTAYTFTNHLETSHRALSAQSASSL